MANLSYEDRKAIQKYLIENPGVVKTAVWGDIEGSLLNQVDLINYIDDTGGAGITGEGKGNANAEFFYYSFKSGQDKTDFFNDGLIKLSWDAPANDLELYMLTEPAGTGDLVSLAAKGDSGVVSTYITQPNFKYDVYPTGVNGTEGLVVWVTAESDDTFPTYKIFLHNAGSSYNSTVDIKKITPKII